MSALLTFDVVATALLAWCSLLWIIPSCNLSVFRYRLWQLRDRVADDIRQGAFDDDACAEEFLCFVEGAIRGAPDFGTVKLLIMLWATRGVPPPKPFDLEALSPADKALTERHLDELQMLGARHAILGSPSGWILIAVGFPVALVASLIARIRKGRDDDDKRSLIRDARSRVRDEVDPGLALVVARPNRSGHSLSRMV
jgi:hypothetical protein